MRKFERSRKKWFIGYPGTNQGAIQFHCRFFATPGQALLSLMMFPMEQEAVKKNVLKQMKA